MPRKPTFKQREAFDKSIDNRGNVSKSMIEAGYSLATAKNPSNLTESDGWKQLLDEYMPEDTLLRVGKEGLGANRYVQAIVGRDDNGQVEYEMVAKPDPAVRHKYFVTGLELRGRLKPDNIINNFQVIVPITITRGENRTEGDNFTPQAI